MNDPLLHCSDGLYSQSLQPNFLYLAGDVQSLDPFLKARPEHWWGGSLSIKWVCNWIQEKSHSSWIENLCSFPSASSTVCFPNKK